ncbi:MAG: 5-formyltetrahydrofolate cyclo-ligase [Pseudohongiella sp.]|jgi:5-formyltetrahydrofolate cyclo-ligase|nr:5-formyltetrahydrofolate cyclo-ligase [Pseudohongiella sp.]MDP1756243.1 5-formyltetrahydrofolate cyclo-ligase [Pseudohongiella sp.]
MSPDSQLTRQQSRRHALNQRRKLSYFQQKAAESALCRRVRRFPVYRQARTISIYLSLASEMGTAALLRMAERDGKCCYVPVLHPLQPHQMEFVRYRAGDRLQRNHWGIAEPSLGIRTRLAARQFDLVMMPLVAFDQAGHRLGMGQGFYDRAFAFRRHSQGKPFLLGLAHECQQALYPLKAQPWDVDMDAVATPARIIRFS